jgi:peptidoglycan hydrolase-like protein with peptidoglycan-binding domain
MTQPIPPAHRASFNEALHPRVPAGNSGGGEFGNASNSKTPAKTTPAKAKTPAKLGPLKSTYAYDAKSNRGPGYGVKGGDAHVKALQQKLNELGVTDLHGRKLAVDGMLGPLTTQSIQAAQRRLGLKADGRVTPELFEKLSEAKTLPKAKPSAHAASHKPAPKPHTSAKPKPKPPAKPAAKPKPSPEPKKVLGSFHIIPRAAYPEGGAMAEPMPQTPVHEMSDDQIEEHLAAILADCSDDEIQHIAALAQELNDDGGQA